jgi:hypothetical protein
MGESDELQIRFRHTLGDIGPFSFEDNSTVQSVKELVFSKWPTGLNCCMYSVARCVEHTVSCSLVQMAR